MSDYPIENKVAKSGLVVIEMDDLVPDKEILEIDIKDRLWEGIALKEKDFRDFVKNHDWATYQGKAVAVHCSADAIVPNWAYMLVASQLRTQTDKIYFTNPEEAKRLMIQESIEAIDPEAYRDARIIVKGCGKKSADYSAYGYLTSRLMPVAKSIMFGEPCSTVPIYKKPKNQ